MELRYMCEQLLRLLSFLFSFLFFASYFVYKSLSLVVIPPRFALTLPSPHHDSR